MLGNGLISAGNLPLLLAVTNVIPPLAILVLCVVAGIGTLLLLPGRREQSKHAIGGAVLALALAIMAALVIHGTAGMPKQGYGIGAYFWIFSIIAIVGAIRVVTHPRPVYSALYFVLTVFASAGLFVLLAAEFLAVALVLIYAGAILVTYVFVIMLASQAATEGSSGLAGLADYDVTSREPFVAVCVGFAMMGVLMFVIFDKAQGMIDPRPLHDSVAGRVVPAEFTANQPTQALGEYLFRHQLINLELAGLILTLAMVGAIVIARRRVEVDAAGVDVAPEEVLGPATPINDNPHSIPVVGTRNPGQKAYPER